MIEKFLFFSCSLTPLVVSWNMAVDAYWSAREHRARALEQELERRLKDAALKDLESRLRQSETRH